MAYIDFLSSVHKRTKRDYLARVNEFPKSETAKVAKQFGFDYWDGDRKFGYGGYRYDGRWKKVAESFIQHYGLNRGDRVLDVGCGKGFLLYDMMQTLPGLEVVGIDISTYAIEHAKPEVRGFLQVGDAADLPYANDSFDLVISLNVIHNLFVYDLVKAIREIERVGKKSKYIVVESYRNLEEKANLMYWVLTGECFFTPEEWEWFYKKCGYSGDYSFIFFE